MKFNALLTVNSVLALGTGAACILIPVQLLAQYGVSLSAMGIVIYQFWGATLIGLGLLVWLVKTIIEPRLQQKIALALFVANGLSCILAIRGQYAGANAFGWTTVLMFFLLALGCGAFALRFPWTQLPRES